MEENDWKEIAIFIHGITPERNPAKKADNPEAQFDTLLRNIQDRLEAHNKRTLDDAIKILWNWTLSDTAPWYEDQKLAKAERILGDWIDESERKVSPAYWPHLLLWKLFYKLGRDIMLYGFSDALYYVSRDGEKTVREHVFKDLSNQLINQLSQNGEGNTRISLTLFGHSAGSLIAHDFLYHLFREQKSSDAVEEIDTLRSLAGEGEKQGNNEQPYPRLRVRRLYTFGSPITPWFIRANSLLNKVLAKEPLKVTDLGFYTEDALSNPRWVNFWVVTDVAAFPLSFLYDNQEVVQDQYINPGLFFPSTHGSYWNSKEMAEHIARTF